MTDYRALCAELLQTADTLLGQGESPANPGERLILTVHLEDLEDCANRARAALAQQHVSQPYKLPEPVAPTDDEIFAKATKFLYFSFAHMDDPNNWDGTDADLLAFARAVLAQWGNQ
jgi:hypothetical protein